MLKRPIVVQEQLKTPRSFMLEETCSLIMKNACTAVAYLETAPRLSNGNRSLISVK